MHTLLPNDFCCLKNSNLQTEQALTPQDAHKQRFFSPAFWIARVVKLTDDGTYRLNWFAEKPDGSGILLKTDHYFFEDAASLFPFKKPLESTEERDFYKMTPEHSSELLKALELKPGKGPSQEAIEDVYDLFQQLDQEDDDNDQIQDQEGEKLVEDVNSVSTASVPTESDDNLKRKLIHGQEQVEITASAGKKPRRVSTLRTDDDMLTFTSPVWTKSVPQVGENAQVDEELIKELVKMKNSDASRETAKRLTKDFKVFAPGKGPSLSEVFSLLPNDPEGKLSKEWTQQEKAAFESGLYEHSEHFDKVSKYIAKAMKREGNPTKNTRLCIEYFYDHFRISRAYNIWNKHEIQRLEKAERQRREVEKQKIKEERRLRKKKLQAMGMDPKLYNYKGESVVKSGKICNALMKIRKTVAEAELFPEITYTTDALNQLQQEAQVGIGAFEVVENDLPKEKKDKAANKDQRTETQLRNIGELLNKKTEDKDAQIPDAFKAQMATLGLNTQDPNQMNYVQQLLQDHQKKMQIKKPQKSGGGGSSRNSPVQKQKKPQVQTPTVSNVSTPSQKASPANVANFQNLQTLQSMAQAQAQAQEMFQRQAKQHQTQQPQGQNPLNILSQLNQQAQGQNQMQLNLANLANLQQLAQNQQQQAQPQALNGLNQLQQNAQHQQQMNQMQLLQLLQARQQQEHASHINQYLQLQQMGQLPPNISLEQYMLLASQQEQFKTQLRQLQLYQQLQESQKQAQGQSQPGSGEDPQQAYTNTLEKLAQQQRLSLQAQQNQSQAQNQVSSHADSSESNDGEDESKYSNSVRMLDQSFQIEKMKLQMTHQQEAMVLQMRQMQELQQAALGGQDRHTLVKKHEAEKKNLVQVQNERQLVLEHEFQQNLSHLEMEQRQKAQLQEQQQTLRAGAGNGGFNRPQPTQSQMPALNLGRALQQQSQLQQEDKRKWQNPAEQAQKEANEENQKRQADAWATRVREQQVQQQQNQLQALRQLQLQQQRQQAQNNSPEVSGNSNLQMMLEQLKQGGIPTQPQPQQTQPQAAPSNGMNPMMAMQQQLLALQNLQNMHQHQQPHLANSNAGTGNNSPSQQMQQLQQQNQQKTQRQAELLSSMSNMQQGGNQNNLLMQQFSLLQQQAQQRQLQALSQLNMLMGQNQQNQQQQQQSQAQSYQEQARKQALEQLAALRKFQEGNNQGQNR